MRIGIDARSYQWEGIGRYVRNLLDELLRVDNEHTYVVFLSEEGMRSFQPSRDRVEKVLADFPHYSVSEQTTFLGLLRRAKLDLVHFPHFNAPIFYTRPFIMTIHDLILNHYPGIKQNPLKQLANRIGYETIFRTLVPRAQHIIAPTRYTAADITKFYHVPKSRITVTYESVDTKRFFYKPTAYPQENVLDKYGVKRPYIMYTGVSRYHKNLEGLLVAFSLLRSMGFPHQLVLVGKKDNNHSFVEETIERLQLANDVVQTGFVADSDLLHLYAGAVAYVFPSFYEGFGLPGLEAMAAGTPVLASQTSCLPEVYGDAAIYFDPASPNDMANAIARVLRDTNLQQDMRKKGLEHVTRFSWEKMARETLDVYNKYFHGSATTKKQKNN